MDKAVVFTHGAAMPTRTAKGKSPVKKPRKGNAKGASYRHGNLREALVEEAVTMMEDRDDSDFTLREVAQRIRVSHTAAYRHFPSKGALLAEMACRGFAVLAAGLESGLVKGASPEEIVVFQAQAYLRTALTHPALFRCMFGPRKFGPENNQAVDESCDVCFQLLQRAATLLSEKHRLGAPAVSEVSLAIWSMVHGLANLALDEQLCEEGAEESPEHYERLARDNVQLLLNGLLPRPR